MYVKLGCKVIALLEHINSSAEIPLLFYGRIYCTHCIDIEYFLN